MKNKYLLHKLFYSFVVVFMVVIGIGLCYSVIYDKSRFIFMILFAVCYGYLTGAHFSVCDTLEDERSDIENE